MKKNSNRQMKTRCVHGAFWLVVIVRGMTNNVIVIDFNFLQLFITTINYKLNIDSKNMNMTPYNIFCWL